MDAGISLLQGLVAEQVVESGAAHDTLGASHLWLGRALLEAGRADEAHPHLDTGLALISDDVSRIEGRLVARHWHGACLIQLGLLDAARAELTALMSDLSSGSPEDELLVATRQLLGSALARSGHYQQALDEFDAVVDLRLLLDLPDAPRVLRARYSRASCLLFLDMRHHALPELNAVINDAGDGAHVADVVRRARNDRAVCLLADGRVDAALDDLDVVVAELAPLSEPGDATLVYARQQRGVCLAALGRSDEARAEFDTILAATTFWAPDPLIDSVREQRAAL